MRALLPDTNTPGRYAVSACVGSRCFAIHTWSRRRDASEHARDLLEHCVDERTKRRYDRVQITDQLNRTLIGEMSEPRKRYGA